MTLDESSEDVEEGDDDYVVSMDPLAASPSQQPGTASKENQAPETAPDDAEVPLTPASGSRSPPERLSEKRRREEDEDDDLGKMAGGPKRRNSLTPSKPDAAADATPTKASNGPSLRRRGTLRSKLQDKDGVAAKNGGISISLKHSPSPGHQDGDGGDGAR